jgi:hypothetical protein
MEEKQSCEHVTGTNKVTLIEILRYQEGYFDEWRKVFPANP